MTLSVEGESLARLLVEGERRMTSRVAIVSCLCALSALMGCSTSAERVVVQAPPDAETSETTSPPPVPTTLLTPEEQARQAEKENSCPECRPLTPEEIAEQEEAARTALPNTIQPRDQANVDEALTSDYASAAIALATRFRRAFAYVSEGGKASASEIDARAAEILSELEAVYSSTISQYQKRNHADFANEHARLDLGGEVQDGYVQLTDVRVVLDGKPYAIETDARVTVVAEAHVERTTKDNPQWTTDLRGVWQWTLVKEQGEWQLLHEVTPLSN